MRAQDSRRSMAAPYTAVLCMALLLGGEGAHSQAQGEATIVFARPSSFGWDASTSIFDVVDAQPVLKGVVQAETRLDVRVPAGAHTFLVLCKGNNPDFISAKLAAGKTYYVTVSLKRRFAGPASCHLEAVHDAGGNAKETDKLVAKLKPVQMNAEAARWEIDNAPSIEERFAAGYAPWLEAQKSEPPMLAEADGK